MKLLYINLLEGQMPRALLFIVAFCVLLFLVDFSIHFILRFTQKRTKKLLPQSVIDLSRELNLEIVEHKATMEGAVLLKARNEYVYLKYVIDDEDNVRQYFNGEAAHFERDPRKKKIHSSYRNRNSNFLIIQCGNDYEIISRIENTMFVFEGKYKNRHKILLLARKYSCVPPTRVQ